MFLNFSVSILPRLGVKAMEVAIERHSLGYRYELPPNFWEEHNKDGTPKRAEK
jgi:hypothetical protein